MQRVADLDTPVMVVDLDKVEDNIRRLQEDLEAPDQRSFRIVRGAGRRERLTGLDQDAFLLAVQHRGEKLVLGGEAVVDHRLGDAGSRRDRIHRRAFEAVFEEECIGGVQDQRPAALGAQMGGALASRGALGRVGDVL